MEGKRLASASRADRCRVYSGELEAFIVLISSLFFFCFGELIIILIPILTAQSRQFACRDSSRVHRKEVHKL